MIHLPTIPHDLTWQVEPRSAKVDGARLHITAGEKTDLFTDPGGALIIANSPRLMFVHDSDFVLSAKVGVAFAATYDAGVLVVYADATHWAKLCFEYSPQSKPMVVSVVTKGASDDCNSTVIDGREVYLRVAGIGRAFAFHYSTDGRWWHMVRYFNLGDASDAMVGFSSQSPTGASCEATFDDIRFEPRTLRELRNGE